MHALKVETNAWDALLDYSGSLKTNTVYPRVVLTQAARYRGTLTSDKDLINRWYAHLKTTVEKNPSFPVLGQSADIPEPVGNNAQPSEALSIRSKGPHSWSTPPSPEADRAARRRPWHRWASPVRSRRRSARTTRP